MPIPPPPTFATPSKPNGQAATNGPSSSSSNNNYNIPLNHLREAPTDASDPSSHASRAAELLARARGPAPGGASNRNASNAIMASKTSAQFAQLSANLNARGAKETEAITGVGDVQEIDAALGEGARRRGRDDELEGEGITAQPSVGAAEKPVNKPVHLPSGSRKTIVVNACQRGNPVLKAIRNVGWEYGDIVPDYQVGANTCVLYLSLKYHRLHPEYLHTRIEKLKGMYLLRVLLIICDVSEHQEPIREITKICLINEMTVVVAWSNDEAATYLATYKAFEHRPPDLLKERTQKDYQGQLHAALTSVRGVNKTDVVTLSTNFGSFKAMTQATAEQLSLCPGLGDVKVKRLYDAFNLPFRVGSKPRPSSSIPKNISKNGSSSSSSRARKEATPAPGQRTLAQMSSAAESSSSSSSRSRSQSQMTIDVDDDNGADGMTGTSGDAYTEAPPVYSPDWPDEEPAAIATEPQDLAAAKESETVNEAAAGAWKDALASDDEDDEDEDEDERAAKRIRT